MATAQTIISRALRLIGKLAAGETPASEDTEDARIALNAMMDSWRLERLMVYALQDQTLSMVASQSSYTIGPSGNLNTVRPVKIETAFMRASNIDTDVMMLEEVDWFGIPDKTASSPIVTHAYYNPTMSTGTLYVYPVPNTTNVLHLVTWTPFTAFAVAADTVTLPPGYERALTYNLAIEIAPEYETDAPASVVGLAVSSKAAIKRVNARPIKSYTELPMLLQQRRSNIITDQA